MSKYQKKCAEYIYEHEFEDFMTWLDEDAENVLCEDTIQLLIKYHSQESNNKITKETVESMKLAAKFHIYASAWLVFIAGLE